MWAKLIAVAALGVAVWLVFLRARGRGGVSRSVIDKLGGVSRREAAEELTPCPVCGKYRSKNEICECDRRPTP